MKKRLVVMLVIVGIGAAGAMSFYVLNDRSSGTDTIVLNTVEEYADAAICPEDTGAPVLNEDDFSEESFETLQGLAKEAWGRMIERQERMEPPEELRELHDALIVWNQEGLEYMFVEDIPEEVRQAFKGREMWTDAYDALPQETRDTIERFCDQRRSS